jgi:hypothetical protein
LGSIKAASLLRSGILALPTVLHKHAMFAVLMTAQHSTEGRGGSFPITAGKHTLYCDRSLEHEPRTGAVQARNIAVSNIDTMTRLSVLFCKEN